MLKQNFFITGTDTGVGKTLITGAIAAFINSLDIEVGVMKPAESGCVAIGFDKEDQKKRLLRADSVFLKEMSGSKDSLDEINPYCFELPLAPGIAAEQEGGSIDFQKIRSIHEEMKKKYRFVLVEGAGGLLVPLTPEKTVIDLIQFLDCSVILIGRAGLGTINHTLLSLEALERRGIDVTAVILNQTSSEKDLSSETNLSALRKRSRLPFWGIFPYLNPEAMNRESLVRIVRENFSFHPSFPIASTGQDSNAS